MDSLTHEEILEVLNRVLFHTTEKMTGMHIRSYPHDLSGDLCRVSAQFEGSCELTLALYAERSFFRHLAQEIFQDPDVTEDDISEAAREYLNVICGRLVGQVSTLIHRPTTIRFPVYNGDYCVLDSELECFCKSQYINEDNESLMLVLTLSPVDNERRHNTKCNLDHLENINNYKGAV